MALLLDIMGVLLGVEVITLALAYMYLKPTFGYHVVDMDELIKELEEDKEENDKK